MVSSINNIANVQQSFYNNITQNNQQNCAATPSSSTNNNVVILNGVRVNGNFFGVTSKTSTDASCLITSNMDDSVSNILSSVLSQTNLTESDLFNDGTATFQTNTYNINQSVTNNISQINSSMCEVSQTQSTNNNYVYVTNSFFGQDFVGVSSETNASANCSMTNAMKNTTYNQAQSSANQSNTVKGMFVAMAGTFAFIVGLIIIGCFILFSSGAIKNVGFTANKGVPVKTPQQTLVQKENEELQAAEESGITPEELKKLGTSDTTNELKKLSKSTITTEL